MAIVEISLSDTVFQLPDFKVANYRDLEGEWVYLATWQGMIFHRWDGSYKYLLRSLDSSFPADLQPHIMQVHASDEVHFWKIKTRREGLYEHKTASAVIDRVGKTTYRIRIGGNNLSEMNELYQELLSSKMRPIGPIPVSFATKMIQRLRHLFGN